MTNKTPRDRIASALERRGYTLTMLYRNPEWAEDYYEAHWAGPGGNGSHLHTVANILRQIRRLSSTGGAS